MSNELLPFVNIVVSGTINDATTNINGIFVLKGLDPGFIRLEASFIGYKLTISSEIEVSVANPNFIEIQMEVQKEQIEEVVVKHHHFEKSKKAQFR